MMSAKLLLPLGFSAALFTAIFVPRWLSPTRCDECSEFALDAARSFREEPWRWREDRHYATRNDGLDFWIANGAESLVPAGAEWNSDDWQLLNLPFGSWEQRYVWTAYQEWHDATAKPPEAWHTKHVVNQ